MDGSGEVYLYDCERLTWSVRQCVEEIQEILAAFYAVFNAASLTGGPPLKSDGVVFSRSPKVTQLFANLSFIFIRLHSLLDYCVKLAIEAAGPPAAFQKHTRMASRGRQFGDRTLADGLIEYEGAQASYNPALTVWRYRLYGGVLFAAPNSRGPATKNIWAISAPNPLPGLFAD